MHHAVPLLCFLRVSMVWCAHRVLTKRADWGKAEKGEVHHVSGDDILAVGGHDVP